VDKKRRSQDKKALPVDSKALSVHPKALSVVRERQTASDECRRHHDSKFLRGTASTSCANAMIDMFA
jgi:hypothetical protein